MTRLRTILKVRTTSVSDAWAGRASATRWRSRRAREHRRAEPAAERPAEALALNRWGEEKGDDVEMLEMSTKAGDVADTAGRRRWPEGGAGGGPFRPRAAMSRSRSPRCARSFARSGLVAAGQPLGGRRSSASQRERHGDLRRPRAPGGADRPGNEGTSRSPPPVLPEGRRRGGDRNSHRRKSISVLSHPAAAGIIE